ncbi:hypothetical protein NSMS1_09630 [Nostoc sp. MS1]|nr:hypothetical protein NSMS1_09630 [Nostoc sp. MS1]
MKAIAKNKSMHPDNAKVKPSSPSVQNTKKRMAIAILAAAATAINNGSGLSAKASHKYATPNMKTQDDMVPMYRG